MKKIRNIAAVLVLAFLLLPLQPAADPATGMLRPVDPYVGDNDFDRAYDIEVDEQGIYIVGTLVVSYDPYGPQPNPWVMVLNSDHTKRCSRRLEFTPIEGAPSGYALAVEHNASHLIVAGLYRYFRYADFALFVAVIDKNTCNVERTYQHEVTTYNNAPIYVWLFGKGVDVAVDETGIYVLAGITTLERPEENAPGFLVLKLDKSLNLLVQHYYHVNRPDFDFASSIAVNEYGVFVVGGYLEAETGIELFRGQMRNHFLLMLDKQTLSPLIVKDIPPMGAKFFAGAEIITDGDEIYLVTVDLYYDYDRDRFVHDIINVVKYVYELKGNDLRDVWATSLLPQYSYTSDDPSFGSSDGTSPPYIAEAIYSYSLSAAVGGPYLYIVGFTSKQALASKPVQTIHGLLIAVDKRTGEGLFSFRIQPEADPLQSAWVFGVDTLRDCAYIAGQSDYYRLEYVFQNIVNKIVSYRDSSTRINEIRLDPRLRNDAVDDFDSSVTFDIDTGSSSYGFYGYFCPGGLMTTTTETVTETTTETSTTYTTSTTSTTYTTSTTRTAYTTYTDYTTSTRSRTLTAYTTSTLYSEQISTLLVTETRYSTLFTTERRFTTDTFHQTTVETMRTTVTDVVTSTTLSYMTVGEAQQTPGLGGVSTTTVYNKTTFVTTAISTVKEPVDWIRLPPWFYLPFFLLPIPLVATVFQGRRARIIIKDFSMPPVTWLDGDDPVVDDVYLSPSVVTVKKGASVEFVNKDKQPHILLSYYGPAEYLFKSEEIKPGKKWRHKLQAPGTYQVKILTKPYAGCVIRVVS